MRKLFTFLFAALMSVSMFANLVTIGSYELTEGSGLSIAKDDITLDEYEYISGSLSGYLNCPVGFKITRVEISGDQLGYFSIGWNDANPWQGSSESVAIMCEFEGDITIYCTYSEAAPNKPTISGEDMFSESTTVTIASSTAGATIYYTIDGSNPTEGGKLVYSDPFTLTQSATIKAAAYKNGQYSTIATKNFIKLTPAPVGPNYVVWDTEFLSNIYCGLKWSTPPVLVNENNVKDGITCIFSGTQAGNSLANNREMYLSAADSKLTFSHESRKITKIEIYGQGGSTCRDWTWDATNFKLVWEGTPAAAVDLQGPESGYLDVNQIYQMVFTLEDGGGSSNSCGDGLTWELNGDVLAISYDGTGTGAMNNWDDENPAPWYDDAPDIKYVEIAEGVTSIGAYAFADCDFFFIDLPASVTSIGENAFSNIAGQGITILSTSCTLPQDLVENGNFERIFVPAASVATYQALFPDDDYRFVEIPSVQQTDNVILWDYNLCTSIMAGSPRDELEILNYHNTQGGITVTAEVDYMHGDVEAGFMYGGIVFECSGKLIFTSAVGNITHIEISGDRYDDPEIAGWTWTQEVFDYGTLSWTGNAASVELPIAQPTTLENTEVKFTLKDGGTTAIENENLKSEIINHKFIKDGMLLIEKNGKIYNAQGAEVR